MNFTKRFNVLAEEMADFLRRSSVEELVRHGFRVGTAGKIVTYYKDDLENTTINTLKDLVGVINAVEGGDINDRFDLFLTEAFMVINEAPRTKMLDNTGYSPSTIAGMKAKGAEGNYQTSKFLMIADAAQKCK